MHLKKRRETGILPSPHIGISHVEAFNSAEEWLKERALLVQLSHNWLFLGVVHLTDLVCISLCLSPTFSYSVTLSHSFRVVLFYFWHFWGVFESSLFGWDECADNIEHTCWILKTEPLGQHGTVISYQNMPFPLVNRHNSDQWKGSLHTCYFLLTNLSPFCSPNWAREKMSWQYSPVYFF